MAMGKGMMIGLGCLGVLVLGVVLFFALGVGTYSDLATKDESCNGSWGQVHNTYQRRNDLIPNYVETAKGYLGHEHSTFEDVAKARQQVTQIQTKIEADGNAVPSPEVQKQYMDAQQGLSSALSRLMVVVEKYPELKADKIMLNLMDELAGTENKIATERRRFQQDIQAYNTALRMPLGWLVGQMICGFKARPYFEAEAGAEKAPKVKF